MSVIELDKHRPKKTTNPVRVTLYWPTITMDDGRNLANNWSAVVDDGNYDSVIEGVRGSGGVYVVGNDCRWFLPWPPAAVRISAP